MPSAMERVKGIEPSYSAWKAAALPLSYTRPASARCAAALASRRIANRGSLLSLINRHRLGPSSVSGGGGWIRTNVGNANGFTARPL